MKVIMLIRSLEIGGAERQLVILAKALHRLDHEVRVVTFYPGGALRPELEAAGIAHSDLRKQGRWDVFGFVYRLAKFLRKENTAVLYSFLPMANIWGAIAGRFAGVPLIAWGVRASNMDLFLYDWMSRLESWLAVRLSSRSDIIICNSYAGADYHRGLGYPENRMITIHNGIDTDQFCYDPSGRDRVRAEWGVEDDAPLIGMIARLDPIKDHATAFRAFAATGAQWPNARLVCIGSGSQLATLKALGAELGIADRLIWAGERQDMAAAYSAVDLVCSSSTGEGFSNTIAEAMACKRLCVVTDVGDSAQIVDGTGWVVPAGDHRALAEACKNALALTAAEKESRELNARHWIVRQFSIETMVTRTLAALEDPHMASTVASKRVLI